MTPFERKMAFLTIVGSGIAAITAALFYVQLREMTHQTEILASQSEGANARAMMDEVNTRTQLGIAKDQETSMKDSVDAANRNTTLTITNAQKTFRDEQRAWVGVVTGPLTTTSSPEVLAYIRNTGKTPAFHLSQITYRTEMCCTDSASGIYSKPIGQTTTKGTLPPEGVLTLAFPIEALKLGGITSTGSQRFLYVMRGTFPMMTYSRERTIQITVSTSPAN